MEFTRGRRGHAWTRPGRGEPRARTGRGQPGTRPGRGRPWTRPGRGGWQAAPTNKTMEPALGELLTFLQKQTLAKEGIAYTETASIKDCSLITSFNWLEGKSAIVIPGQPPKWTPLSEPRQLSEDAGEYFRDQNAARYPSHPMEPTAIVLLRENPSVLVDLDIVACGNTLGNLLRFVRGKDKPFRMLVELVGETVFFIRRENTPAETIEDIRGFGHSFPEAYTTWDAEVRGSESHQRVIKYSFGGLRLAVRSEADGYLGRDKEGVLPRPRPPEASVDSLITDLAVGTIAPLIKASPVDLQVKSGGTLITQDSVFDLKTRSFRKKDWDILGEELPRLWVRQIYNFILAYHHDGIFDDVDVRDVREDIRTWEKAHVEELSQVAALLHAILEVVRTHPKGKVELRFVGHGDLEVRQKLQGVESALSEDTTEQWIKDTKGPTEDAQNVNGPDVDDKDGFSWAGADEPDFTACTEACGYCGECTY